LSLGWVQYAIIAAYLLFIVIKGLRRSRDIAGADDFLLAGRKVGWPLILCTVGATVIGGGASIGAVGKTFEWGVLMMAVSTAWYLQLIVSGLLVAPRFREARLYTVAGYFGHRFGAKPRFAAFVLSLLFSVGVLGAQMVAFGKIITLLVPLAPYWLAVVAGGVVVTLYSTVGGLPAVIHTDVYQFVILLAGFAITLVYCVPELVGSADEIARVVPEHFFSLWGDRGPLFLITTFLAFLLGETFAPAYATRFCIGEDARATRRGIVGAGVLLAFTYPAVLFFIALYARLNFPHIDPEQALPHTILRLNNPVVGGLVIAALMSAVMSSADSILNSTTSIFVKDLYEPYVARSRTGSRKGLRIARWSSAALGVLGVVMALVLPDIIDMLLLTYSLWAPGIIVPVLVGVLTRTSSATLGRLVFGTMVLSTAATVLYMTTPWADVVQPGVVGVGVSCVIFALGLLVTRTRLRRG
jgi:SSS family solute:Na+ symporter